ncbi:hypothetical protein HPB49_004294 [Dermacentor silvarum]|uniref:Uncharacterized protein n=1 Tax=Dermacentor silvarum TaxID=543639 RepID=A0ACB8D2T3_DERSI|nr:hypothetical protein HPB49_004294 [Dermacentor silvarum]
MLFVRKGAPYRGQTVPRVVQNTVPTEKKVLGAGSVCSTNNKGPSNRGTTPHAPNRTTKGTAQAMKPSVQDKTTRRRREKLEGEAVPAPSQDFPIRRGTQRTSPVTVSIKNPVPVPIEDEETGVTTKGDQQHQRNASRRRCKGELGRHGLLCSEAQE